MSRPGTSLVVTQHFRPQMFWEGGEASRRFHLTQYTLRQFTRFHEAEAAETGQTGVAELLCVSEGRLTVLSDSEAKEKLSGLLIGGTMPTRQFYRLAPSGANEDVLTRSTCLDISFYLFEDGRLCPVRIWSASERFQSRSGGPAWSVDFNGIPPWSRVLALSPQWERCPGERSSFGKAPVKFAGSSARNWFERDCWRVPVTPQEAVPVSCEIENAAA